MIKIKAVLFDLDGTLINTNELILDSFRYIFKKFLNLLPSDEEIYQFFGEPLITTMERYDKYNAENLCQEYFKHNEKLHDELASEIEGAYETVKALKEASIKIAVVTSKRIQMAERGLKLFKLYDLVDVIISPESTEKHKPNGEPALKACEMLNVKPEEAIMVGDSHFDILCGKNAGTKTCLVKYSLLPIDQLMKFEPDYAIDSLNELLKLV